MSESNNNNDPLPPLPPLKGSSKVVKRRGRPPGSKNWSRKEKYKRICRETAEAASVALVNEDDDNNFGVHMTGREDDNDNEIKNELYDANEGDVGFGSPDLLL